MNRPIAYASRPPGLAPRSSNRKPSLAGPQAAFGTKPPRGHKLKVLKAVGWGMVTVGALILAFLAYQLIGTNFINARAQQQAAEDLIQRIEDNRRVLAAVGGLPPSLAPVTDMSTSTNSPVATPDRAVAADMTQLFTEPIPDEGDPLGWISIPRIGLDYVLMEGVDRSTLKSGPGHMPWTPLPGQPGNAAVSGHRTTYGAPFFDLDLLEPGDEIIVETTLGLNTYTIRESIVVEPTDVWVAEPRPGAWLTLTTCTPKFSARQRLIVFAELTDGPNYPYVQQEQEREPADAAA